MTKEEQAKEVRQQAKALSKLRKRFWYSVDNEYYESAAKLKNEIEEKQKAFLELLVGKENVSGHCK